MSELKESHIPAAVSTEPDPLGKLYHMSTTAGVGSQEYVAVNVVSVVAILLGLASSLALLGPALLGIPILALIFAIIALWQIAHSGGTQTGRMLAWGGIALAVLFAAMEGTRIAAEHRRDAQDQHDIASLVTQLGQAVLNNQIDQAYGLFGPDFQNRVPIARFKVQMQLIHENPAFGQLTAMTPNGDVLFDGDYDAEVRQAFGRIEIQFNKHAPGFLQARYGRHEDVWTFDDLPELFPASSPGR
ncbi:MAG TPA: DUF4190 domain-containing protein [Tepidisphaeraceae bacterium]|jgi:hypothetical protein